MTEGSRKRLALLALALAVGWAGLSFAQDPRASCHASVAGGRVVVDVELEGFLDKELLRLIKLGLEGRLSLEVAVVKRRRFWFDAPVEVQSKVASLRYTRSTGKLFMDGRREVVNPALLALERVALRVGADPEETYGVEVTARLQVVTAQSLDKLAEWISNRRQREATPVPRNVLQAVADDLARGASAQCDAVARPRIESVGSPPFSPSVAP